MLTRLFTISDNAAMCDKVALADKLKQYRIKRCWTQKQMANRLGLDASAICKMERGKYRWTDLMVAKILRSLPDLLDSAA
ncbi:MAG: helix-turn-helix transcriptional regulator [Acidobacteria bacterium]|nr:helix-turn-helix transcriptional regulator [Acidobacteriota bacterium]